MNKQRLSYNRKDPLRFMDLEQIESPIAAMAWHRQLQLLAVCHKKDMIFLYDLAKNGGQSQSSLKFSLFCMRIDFSSSVFSCSVECHSPGSHHADRCILCRVEADGGEDSFCWMQR